MPPYDDVSYPPYESIKVDGATKPCQIVLVITTNMELNMVTAFYELFESE